MNNKTLIAALAAAFILPAAAAVEAPGAPSAATPPAAPKAPRAPKAPSGEAWSDSDFNFKFDFDWDMLLADASDASRQAMESAERMKEWAQSFSADMQGSMAFMFGDRMSRGKVVKNAPYSAEVVTETRQTLADGNVISHQNASRVYRDGEGRTRQETYRGEKLRTVYISDPVGGNSYTLMPGAKIAVAIPRHGDRHFEERIERRAPRAEKESDKSSNDGKNKERVVVRRVETADGTPGREEVRVQVYRFNEDGKDVEIIAPPVPPVPPVPPTAMIPPIPPMPPIPGVQTLRFESTARLGKGTTTSLGMKDIEGVKAEGKSTQWTIPAGQIGNAKPIVVTSETWYSPDLQVTVYSRYADPRTGESIYRLASVKRAEPAADLFKVPDDYKLRGKKRDKDAPEAKR